MKQILVGFTLSYFRFWARIALSRHKPVVIGVAGSVGKSSTCQAFFALLKDYYSTKLIKGNSETGIPLGLLGLEVKSLGFDTMTKSIRNWLTLFLRAPFSTGYLKQTDYIIVEMGIDSPDSPKNMEYLLTIIKPDIAIELNIAPPHLGQFEKLLVGKNVEDKLGFLLDQMAEEDTKIISKSNCKTGIYNNDDKRVKRILETFERDLSTRRSSSVGMTCLLPFGSLEKNTVSYKDYAVSLGQTTFSFILNKKEMTLSFPGLVLPKDYRETFAAAIILGLTLKLSLEQIQKSLQKNFVLPNGRASVFQGIHQTTIIDSSYNASPKAVATFLDLTAQLKKQTKRPIVFLFGDMRELGNEEETEHKKVAKKIAETVDYLYCVGPLTRKFVIQEVEHENKNLPEIRWFDCAIRAGEYLQDYLPENALVLVKGSQNTIYLEEAVKYLLVNKEDVQKLCRQEDYWLKKKVSSQKE